MLKLRKKNKINLICAPAFKGMEALWSIDWQRRYNKILESADYIHYTGSCYGSECYSVRNKWIVDHSSMVIAVYNGQPGGTRNTLKYANSQGTKVKIIYPKNVFDAICG